MFVSSSAAGAPLEQHVPRGKMSRVSVGNLINHTSQNTGGPVSVRPPPPPPPASQVQPGPQSQHPRLHVYTYTEFQRRYYAVREYSAVNGGIVYPYPCDDEEDNRLDVFHALIHDYAFSGRLHHAELAPRESSRLQVLDIGHGTGIWVYEMAEQNKNADVVGMDLHSRTPVREQGSIPNAHFVTPWDFLDSNWPCQPGSKDLIRMGQLCGSVPDWFSLYRTVAYYLQPGTGYVEHIELDWTPRQMEGYSIPQQATELFQWWQAMRRASADFGKPIDCPTDVEQLMERSGLTDVTHRTVRVPLRPRAHDQKDHNLCWCFKMAVSMPDDENGRIPPTFEALSMSLFCRHLRWSEPAVRDMCARLRAIVNVKDLPIYFTLHVWTARRPRS